MTLFLRFEIHKSILQVVMINGSFLMVHYKAIWYVSHPEHYVFKGISYSEKYINYILYIFYI